mmetsp:Transcript_103934/g.298684  ORF Transcript_103934/g.298684 Transcript_103934/m.298684 type:complete len:710 (-) Transcript_103934:505-2634(-)
MLRWSGSPQCSEDEVQQNHNSQASYTPHRLQACQQFRQRTHAPQGPRWAELSKRGKVGASSPHAQKITARSFKEAQHHDSTLYHAAQASSDEQFATTTSQRTNAFLFFGVHDVVGDLCAHRLAVLVERPWLELGRRVAGQLRRHDLIRTLEELCEIVEDLRVLRCDHGGGQTLVASTSCSANAVCVVFDRLRHIEIDDLHDTLDVETTSSHVGGHEDIVPALFEGVHSPLSLLLALAAVDRTNAVAAVVQGLGQHIHGLLLVDEDNDRRLRTHQHLLQAFLFLGLADEFQSLLDVFLRVARITDADDGWTSQECPRHALNGRRHRRAKHLRDTVLPVTGLGLKLLRNGLLLRIRLHVRAWDGKQRSPNIILKSEIDHLVGFVDHDIVALVEDGVPLVQGIAQTAGRGQANLGTLAQGEGLLLCISATDDADDTHAGDIGRELLGLLLNLQDQFSARSQDDAIGTVLGRRVSQRWQILDVCQQRKHVGCGFPTACFGDCDQVAVLARNGNGLHLNGRGLGITNLVDGLKQLPRQGALSPDSHGVRHPAAADEDLEVLAEDAPIAGGHLVHRFFRPMHLVIVFALDVALLEADGLLRRLDERRDVFASVLRAFRDQLFVETVIFALLTYINACTVTTAEEQLRLTPLRVERIVVASHCVVVRIPLEVEDIPELLGRLLHLLLCLLHAQVMFLNELKLFFCLTLSALRLWKL